MVAVSEPARTLPPRAADCGGCLDRAIDGEICDATTGEGIEIESTPLAADVGEGGKAKKRKKAVSWEGKGIAGRRHGHGMRCFDTFFLSSRLALRWFGSTCGSMAGEPGEEKVWKVLVNVVG
jgi:hypothetical protein